MASLIVNHVLIKTIIFDFDGTLAKLNIDFNEMRKAVEDLILSYGIEICELPKSHILEMIKIVQIAIHERSPKKSLNFYREANGIIENIEMKAAARGELFDDAKELLDVLKKQKISYGIITRNCARAVKIVFPDISHYCPAVVCRDDVKNVKPDPEHILTALTKLNSLSENTLMTGDHPLDIETGRNAGCLTCGVLTGRTLKKDFIEAGADLVLKKACNILNLIK